ncbi:MAG: GMP synthase (glutamine-hydrolyzing) [Anaerolinea sp.]|nr:GMP synthase (glutamine-hydrolyzing) [Anaerolinea sp.]
MTDSIAILDFGSQYAQLIARRVREAHVYCELFAWDTPVDKVLALKPKGFILSGGPRSVYEDGAPYIQKFILDSGLPILGICYGMQALTFALGGQVNPASEREYGLATITPLTPNPLTPNIVFPAWMSHGDRITQLPAGFIPLAKSDNSPLAAMGDLQRKYFGVQFHPEVRHTPDGAEILRRFVVEICGAQPDWTPASIIEESVTRIRAQVGSERVLAAVSGGVDSSVAAVLVQEAIGDQLVAVFVDTGLMRQGEAEQVVAAFRRRPMRSTYSVGKTLGVELVAVDAAGEFLSALRGVTDPEQKRKIVGEKFIRIFEAQARKLGQPRFLVQGTIYPDVVESSAPERDKVERIKTHHNVGGLPQDMSFELVEPLRYLFKDEVRDVGEALGLPLELVWRQPFPGPGLTVRCLGEVTAERLARLRAADAILIEELSAAGLLGKGAGTSQAFVVLLPVRSVGVMGDQRTYQEAAAIRAVVTDDFMTADWARLPHELLARVANRIVNEAPGINRVVYDITSKPPATIEWE